MGFNEWSVTTTDLEWTQKLWVAHTFYICKNDDGSLQLSCSRDADSRKASEPYGKEVEFEIPAHEAPEFLSALQAWIEQLQ